MSAISRAPASSPSAGRAVARGRGLSGARRATSGSSGAAGSPGRGAQVARLLLEPGEALVEALAALAQGVEQAAQLALEVVEARQHAAGGVLHARDVV